MKIKNIYSYEIIASGGYPSIETVVELEDGTIGKASVPYGASAGSHEASVLLDGDKSRFRGKGMEKSVGFINGEICENLRGWDATDQRAVDNRMKELDGTPNKTRLGGNTILSVSIATARAAANFKKMELYEHIVDHFKSQPNYSDLPKPMVVVIEGGKHASNSTDVQEYCLTAVKNVPTIDNLQKVLETYHNLKQILNDNGLNSNVGNEGAFAPSGIESNTKPFDLIVEAMKVSGYTKEDLGISIDAAASEFFEKGKYNLKLEGLQLDSMELIQYYRTWLGKYPLITVEDMLDEDDWQYWPVMKKLCDEYKLPLIGDDLTVTNPERLQKALDTDSISGILIKLNQIGTLTETVDTCMQATNAGIINVPSHRGGGETNDTAMIDLAVAVGAKYIKVGPTRGERVEKYNRLIEIERILRA